MLVLIICLAFGVTSVIAILTIASRLLFPQLPRRRESFSKEVLDLSTQGYMPMLRVVDEKYFEFFQSQPGFTRQAARRLRAQRYHLFIEYLNGFQSDFNAVMTGLKRIFIYLREERPNMSRLLARANSAFIWDFGWLRLRAYFWKWGFGGVDVRELLTIFDELNRNLRSMLAAPANDAWTRWDD